MADPDSVSAMAKAAITHLAAFSGVVNYRDHRTGRARRDERCAGMDLDDSYELDGTMLVSRAVMLHVRTIGQGKIVNFSGGGATSPRPRFSAYAASKAAVVPPADRNAGA